MLIVLSPAKSLNFDPIDLPVETTSPEFIADSSALIADLKKMSVTQISELMSISDQLASLNVARYAIWSKKMTQENSKPALFAFNGDVYEGLEAKSLKKKQLQFAQDHVRILSGLYGILRPLDLMQAYRLEMGTSLATKRGKDLYAFWGTKITQKIREELSVQAYPTLLNLASEEYFKVLQTKDLGYPVISPVFQDEKEGKFKIISFYAKKARGLMTRFVIDHQIQKPQDLQRFDSQGYRFVPSLSTLEKPVFQRKQGAL